MTKSCGEASAAKRRASASTLVSRWFKPHCATGTASSAMAAAKVTKAARQIRFSDGSGRPKSRHTATSAAAGRKYHGWVGTAANQRKPVNPTSAASRVAPAKTGKSSGDIFSAAAADCLVRANSAAPPKPSAASTRNSQTKAHAGLGNPMTAEKLPNATAGANPVRSETAEAGNPEMVFQYGSNDAAANNAARSTFPAARKSPRRPQTVHAPRQTAAISTAFW